MLGFICPPALRAALLGIVAMGFAGMSGALVQAAENTPAGRDGGGPLPFELIASNIRVEENSSVKVEPGSADQKPVKELVVRARMDWPSLVGVNPALQVKVNGQIMDFARVRNRQRRIQINGGRLEMGSCAWGDVWLLYYAPDFKPVPASSEWAPLGFDPYELRFDVSDLWKAGGGNTIELTETFLPGVRIVADVGVSQTLSPSMKPAAKPAPTGPIPTILPVTEASPDYHWEQLPGGAIEIRLGDQQWIIESRFSTTSPGWARLLEHKESKSQWISLRQSDGYLAAAARDFKLQRTITRHDDHLQVVDRITNTSSVDLPVMFAHQTRVDRRSGTLYITGLPAPQAKLDSNKNAHPNGYHPTTLMMWDKSGLGLVGEDDITRAQGIYFCDQDVMGMRDERLVVGRGRTVELEFSIYPLDSGDRFDFINRIRRNWNVNFTIDGSEAQAAPSTPPGMYLDMTDEQLKAQMVNRSVRYLLGVVWDFNFPGLSSELTQINADRVTIMNRAKALCPDIQRMVYYHAYLGYQDPRDYNAHPEIVEVQNRLFQKDKIQWEDGSWANYSDPGMPLFLPTVGSAWAKAQDSLIDFRLEQTGAEGVFWDETAYSANAYDYNPDHWDGVSAIIDPKTHKIVRKVTNVILASQPWRLSLAKRLLARGPLRGNGAPQTRSFTQLHFPRSVETWTFNMLSSSQLYTPVGMGDHMFEKTEVDAYQDMVDGLDHGTVYYWYSSAMDVTHPTLTSQMFPITPINLGHGYIIAKERILTNRSGYFGWGDKSEFQAYVYDNRGYLTDKVKIPVVERDGKIFAEVRIPGGYSVALVRK